MDEYWFFENCSEVIILNDTIDLYDNEEPLVTYIDSLTVDIV